MYTLQETVLYPKEQIMHTEFRHRKLLESDY